MNKDLLYADDLAAELGVSRGYVYAMKSAGFVMPGKTAKLEEARDWLRENPGFKSTEYCKGKGARKKSWPGSDNEKAVFAQDGEEIARQPDLGLFDQAMIDSGRLFENLKAQDLPGDLGEDALAALEPELGRVILQKIAVRDVGFFKALAALVKRRADDAPAKHDFLAEMLRLKSAAVKGGERHSIATIQSLLSSAVQAKRLDYLRDEKTIRRAAKEIGYPVASAKPIKQGDKK